MTTSTKTAVLEIPIPPSGIAQEDDYSALMQTAEDNMIAAFQASSLTIPASSPGYSGIPLTGTAGETLALGDAVYQKAADGRLWKAKADAVGTMAAVGVIVVGGDATDSVTYIDNGYIRNDSWDWTVGSSTGGKVYVSPVTAGLITQTAPSTVGDQLQEIGYAHSADVLRIAVNALLVGVGEVTSVDLESEVTGVLPVTNGGTGGATAQAAIDALTAVDAAYKQSTRRPYPTIDHVNHTSCAAGSTYQSCLFRHATTACAFFYP